MRLKDKVAIVTGGSRGIGRAIALRLGQEGARVAVVHQRGSSGEEVAQQIRQAGSPAIAVRCDVADICLVQAMVARVLQEWGTVDILVNNAAVCPFRPFLEMPEALWDQVLDTNLKGYFLCSQAVAQVMVERRVKGRIIAIRLDLGRVRRQPAGTLLRLKSGHQPARQVDGDLTGAARHHL